MTKRILVIGTFDSKKLEYEFLINKILELGFSVVAMDIGTYSKGLDVDVETISAAEVLRAAGTDVDTVVEGNDRGQAMNLMATGASLITRDVFQRGEIAGVVGMGGSGGSSVISKAMQVLPIGFPKVLLSTMAGGNTQAYIGTKDVVMIPSITDISGLNRISRKLIFNTAAAITGMAGMQDTRSEPSEINEVIAISMFGNTTDCVNRCMLGLANDLTEVVVFHATGIGGQAMEQLIDDGFIDGCLDITITELADEVCGGILNAGPSRLSAAGRKGIPHLVVPGCIDMVNFGPLETVPKKYRSKNRNFYEWNPSVTLMRTNVEENVKLAKIVADHLNRARGPVQVMLPLQGVSILDADGERFCDREADFAMFDTLKSRLSGRIPVHEVDCNINDPEFSDHAVKLFREMMKSTP